MARRNRPSRPSDDHEELDVERILRGSRRTETRRGQAWTVQPIPEANALKEYVCPGCPNLILPGVAHVAVWRSDGVLGDERDLHDRRHWHTHCWRMS